MSFQKFYGAQPNTALIDWKQPFPPVNMVVAVEVECSCFRFYQKMIRLTNSLMEKSRLAYYYHLASAMSMLTSANVFMSPQISLDFQMETPILSSWLHKFSTVFVENEHSGTGELPQSSCEPNPNGSPDLIIAMFITCKQHSQN